MKSRLRGLAPVAFAATLPGCREEPEPAPAPRGPAPSASTSPAPEARKQDATSHPALVVTISGRLDSPTAFDLAVHPSGATLAWAEGDASRTRLLARTFAADGAPSGDSFALLDDAGAGTARDLHFAWLARSPVAAWIQHTAGSARLRAVLANDPRAPEVFELGAAGASRDSSRDSARGQVALSVDDRRATVFAQGAPEPCARGGGSECHGLGFHHVPPDSTRPDRVALEVPTPCPGRSVLLAMTRPRWHYAVCTQDGGRSALTVFDIQPEPQYASAKPLLAGCSPLGVITIDGHPSIVASCNGRRTIAHLQATDAPVPIEPATPVEPACTQGKLWLRVGAKMHAFAAPQRDVELLLPPSIAPEGSLAAWSGGALLVASARGRSLDLQRYVCNGSDLVPGATP